MMVTNNRKSHLQAPLSPNTQALLRSGDFPNNSSPSTKPDTANTITAANNKTPTSGEIPVVNGAHASRPSAINTQSSSDQHIQRISSAEMNGTTNGGDHVSHNPLDRPTFPPRTSSTSVVGGKDRSDRESQQFIPSTVMPIRPAPPPNGPLPHPPGGSSMRMASRRQGMYSQAEGHPL